MPDSSWLRAPSSHVGAAQRELRQRPEAQSRSPLQALSVAQPIGQLSPQSRAGSRPLRTPSVQLPASGTSQALTSSPEQAGTHAPFAQVSPEEQSSGVMQQLGLEQLGGAPASPLPPLLPSVSLPPLGALSRLETSFGSKSSCVNVQAKGNNAKHESRATHEIMRRTGRFRRFATPWSNGAMLVAFTRSRTCGWWGRMWLAQMQPSGRCTPRTSFDGGTNPH
jgi:hypothetical protein